MRNRQERYMGMDEDELYRMKMERSSRRISPRKDEEEEILAPMDLIQRYEEQRASLNAEIDRVLEQITNLLGGNAE